jgi:hypothetical protein
MLLKIWLISWAALSFAISRKTKSIVTIVGGGLICSLIAVMIVFFINPSLSADSEAIDACAIAQEYDHNELAAIAKYDDKWFTIKGAAGAKGDGVGGLFLQIPCGRFWPAAQCSFDKSKALDLAYIKPGQIITIKGRCKSKTLGSVIFDKCSIISK